MSSMTRKHFEDIAQAFAALAPSPDTPLTNRLPEEQGGEAMRRVLALEMARICQRHNPSFDKGRFFAACRVPL